MACFYYICVLLLLVQLSQICSTAKTSNGSVKVGRKERCRHIVRKEAQKYSRRVQTLTDRVFAQQASIEEMEKEHESEALEMEAIRYNLTEQQNLLNAAVSSIEELQRQMQALTRLSTTPEPDYDRTPKGCDDIHIHGGTGFSGSYQMMIQPTTNSSRFQVLCEQIDQEGWIVVQQRVDGLVDFRRSWEEYKNGFGKFETEFWLGNDHIHQITSAGPMTLRVELEEFSGEKRWAEYSHFSVGSDMDNYAINVSGYSGNAGDDLQYINGQQFSTFDNDHDRKATDNCAHQYSSGWWYKLCGTSNLNARYLDEDTHNSFLHKHGIVWSTIHPYKTLKHTKLLLKTFHHR